MTNISCSEPKMMSSIQNTIENHNDDVDIVIKSFRALENRYKQILSKVDENFCRLWKIDNEELHEILSLVERKLEQNRVSLSILQSSNLSPSDFKRRSVPIHAAHIRWIKVLETYLYN